MSAAAAASPVEEEEEEEAEEEEEEGKPWDTLLSGTLIRRSMALDLVPGMHHLNFSFQNSLFLRLLLATIHIFYALILLVLYLSQTSSSKTFLV